MRDMVLGKTVDFDALDLFCASCWPTRLRMLIPPSVFYRQRIAGAHLRRIGQACARYYNDLRTDRSLEKHAPFSRRIQRNGRSTNASVSSVKVSSSTSPNASAAAYKRSVRLYSRSAARTRPPLRGRQNLIHLRMKSLGPFSVDKRLKLLHLGLHHGILRNDIGAERNEGLHHRGLLLRRQLENFAFVGKP
jgi:hypothetical protein